jgi:hypothetical protein
MTRLLGRLFRSSTGLDFESPVARPSAFSLDAEVQMPSDLCRDDQVMQ